MTWTPKVRTLLAGLFLVVLILPILSFGVGRVFENLLVRHTEQTLIAESTVVGETYRRLLHPFSANRKLSEPAAEDARFQPILAQLDLSDDLLLEPAIRRGTVSATTGPAGRAVSQILERTMVRNLTGVRVLDPDGLVVASPEYEYGYSLAHLPEVIEALGGRYGAVIRRRYTDHPSPPLTSISRTALLRVSIALPIHADPRGGEGSEIIGVVYNSRTPLGVEKSLWLLRHELAGPALLSLFITLALVLLLSWAIASPLQRLRGQAERVAAGEPADLEVRGFAPQEVRVLSAALERMRDQAESRATYIETFAANTAHELKTPLTSLRGAAELLLDADVPEDRAKKFLGNIRDDAMRMDELVQRILELARIEAAPAPRELIDLRAFFDGLAERYARRDVEVRVTYPGKKTHAFLNQTQFDSMMTNLVDNAARHGGGEPVDVVVHDRRDDLRVEVRDHGPKLPPEHFEKVFERFYTTDRASGGTGLGLSIVLAIAEAHGGRVDAVAHEDGASFFVTLPDFDPSRL